VKASSLRARTAVVGIGATSQGEHGGLSGDDLAIEAVKVALADAAIEKRDIDGLITCRSNAGQGTDTKIGELLGISPSYSATLDYGTCNFSLHLAAMAIAAGMAETVLLCYGTNQRSARRNFGVPGAAGDLTAPFGLVHVAGPAALALTRHQHQYGTTEAQFAHIAVGQRAWAQLNPQAIFREPLSVDEHQAMPYLVRPLRRPDVTMISDGGAAVVLTAADRVDAHPHPAVFLLAMAQNTALALGGGPLGYERDMVRAVGKMVFERAGVTASDIDALYIQDPTAVWVLQMLEQYGFCGPGEAGPFLAERHTFPGGDLPLNTNGGQLSESYMWGWLHVVEAVRQLRGECGARQVPAARIAMYCSTMTFIKAAATIFGTAA
jgi:acetyl-CoA acetyltransferase